MSKTLAKFRSLVSIRARGKTKSLIPQNRYSKDDKLPQEAIRQNHYNKAVYVQPERR